MLALLDCIGRESAEFPAGATDRREWILWLCVG
ncbi:MAG: hypothetical protein QOF81_168, partial [Acidimicrobiaceae bacterium]|nr:hypothetical protein [Acidimicrobiaceae bacterium]